MFEILNSSNLLAATGFWFCGLATWTIYREVRKTGATIRARTSLFFTFALWLASFTNSIEAINFPQFTLAGVICNYITGFVFLGLGAYALLHIYSIAEWHRGS